jgi:hypothetical protein
MVERQKSAMVPPSFKLAIADVKISSTTIHHGTAMADI